MADYWAGFDTFSYPGDQVMQSLWDDTNLYWCGFYLGSRFNWQPHYRTIAAMGWGVAPVYTGKQPLTSPKLKAIIAQNRGDPDALRRALYDNGSGDGLEAVQQARAASMPGMMILYFDVEVADPDANWLPYFKGWCSQVRMGGYRPGIYTRAAHAVWLTTKLITNPDPDTVLPEIWIARYMRANANGAAVPPKDFLPTPFPTPAPAKAGGGATSWQHIGNFGMKWADGKTGRARRFAPVDFNSSIYRNPGMGFLGVLGDLFA